jgi:WD40 repeat protein
VFDVSTGETVFDRAKHDKGITGLVFLDHGKCLLSTAADGTIKFWHVPSGTELLTMRMDDSIYQPSINADGSIVLWNQRSGPRYFLIK